MLKSAHRDPLPKQAAAIREPAAPRDAQASGTAQRGQRMESQRGTLAGFAKSDRPLAQAAAIGGMRPALQAPLAKPTGARQPLVQRSAEFNEDKSGKAALSKWQSVKDKAWAVVNASSFGQSNKHHILLEFRNTDQDEEPTSGYTQLYDKASFEGVKPASAIDSSVAHTVKIVLFPDQHQNQTGLFTTFLHEWIAHAVPAMKMVETGATTPGPEDRDWSKAEHLAYADLDEEVLKGHVGALNLSKLLASEVLGSVKRDQQYARNAD
ncbi:MAG TPA: hypothetical protein VK195_14490 [Burkholderiaceae bacterium]|nr:hypothetical protein [Burkholderiaceae bacterium]